MEKSRIPSALTPAVPEAPVLIEHPQDRDCAKCSFYGILNGHTPICRFNPPLPVGVLITDAKGEPRWMTNSVWPGVIPGQWCGKFTPRIDVMS